MDYLKPISEAIAPVAVELLVALLGIVLASAMTAVRRYFGLRAEALLREALNQAILTGVMQTSGNATIGERAADAVRYARKSSPDAIRKLKATEAVLIDKARAVIKANK